MPDPLTPEAQKLLAAIDTFGEQPPRDLPDGLLDNLKEVGRSLRGYTGNADLSPGEREAVERQNQGSDTAVDFRDAVKGPDQPSPGQREFAEVQRKAQDLAQTVSGLGTGVADR